MSLRRSVLGLMMAGALLSAVAGTRAETPIVLALDGEFGHATSTSAQAIERGILIAIEEINAAGGVLGGRALAYRKTDNRGISAMAVDNVKDLAADPTVLGVFGGKFSPLQIEVLPIVHQAGILLLDPWGSADPITDHDFRPSYSFRLSLKDSHAAPAMLQFARRSKRAERIGILLPNTSWGRSNDAALKRAAGPAGVKIVASRWYNWGDRSLIARYAELRAADAEAILLVANEVEGSILVREIANLPASERVPIIAHWGVTGGAFVDLSGPALQQVDFSVIQTFSFDLASSPRADHVRGRLERVFGIPRDRHSISVVGTAHAYDLVHLVARAIDAAGSAERAAVRDALERLGPFAGLVRTYDPPFTPDRHDALFPEDIFFARFNPDGSVVPLKDGR
jgi:branched-chain amino acid transport system substrate-binding protein